MDLQYTITEKGIKIDKVPEQTSIVLIPETIDDIPVIELGAYALAESETEELHLPRSIEKIGAYACYNCEQLKRIFCHSRISDIGTGVFTGIKQVEVLDFTIWNEERSCLQELLNELRQTLRVRIHGDEEARLIFPDYYEEMVENTPARILYIETHGCGHRYRYCFEKRKFQYREYDQLFYHAQVQTPELLVIELAIGRLVYPYGLTKEHELMYRTYIASHWQAAGTLILRTDCKPAYRWNNLDRGLMPWFAGQFITDPGQVITLAEIAQQEGHAEAVSWLMNFKHETFAAAETRRRRFEL